MLAFLSRSPKIVPVQGAGEVDRVFRTHFPAAERSRCAAAHREIMPGITRQSLRCEPSAPLGCYARLIPTIKKAPSSLASKFNKSV